MEFIVQKRLATGKSANRKLKKAGMSPGNVYGLVEPLAVQMDSRKAYKLIHDTRGRHVALDLKIHSDGEAEETRRVIIQDFQTGPYKKEIFHVDFREVNDDTELNLKVPIKIVGESHAVKLGGTLQVIRREIPIHCKAKYLPNEIEVDVTELNFGGSIHVLDIPYPEGSRPVVSGRNFTLITVAGRMKEVEAEAETAEETEES